MKITFLSLLLLLNGLSSLSQNREIDSLNAALKTTKTDTGKIILLYKLSQAYQNSQPDSALMLAQDAYLLAKKKKFVKGESWGLSEMAFAFNNIGNFPKALEYYIAQLNIEETRGYPDNIAGIYLSIALLYDNAKDFDNAIMYALRADSIINANQFENLSLYCLLDLGEIYEKKNMLDSALTYTNNSYEKSIKAGNRLITGTALNNLGNIYFKLGKFSESLKNYEAAIPILSASDDYTNYAESNLGIARIFARNHNLDSAIIYGKKAFNISWQNNFQLKTLDASIFLSDLYKKNNKSDSAFAYQQIMLSLKDSIDSREKIRQFQNIAFAEQLKLRELEEDKIQVRNAIRMYALLAGVVVFMVIAFLLFRNNRIRRKSNRILENQKNQLQKALLQLKETQTQLIHSEKMASLGELTAGIAHEIQNPLNFVNNFSEVNAELIKEMKDELNKGNLAEVKAIANDIDENGQKINHHGKRADAIVKGMLQHSRKSTGQKELSDINALVDEYLKLSYNGIRAKDKSFNAITKTHFDVNAGKINIVPQDISRVLLNLYNNAFYAVSEKSKTLQLSQHESNYEPTVSVTTARVNHPHGAPAILITISDNGGGIHQQILEKIFQPFFTTKPTGLGTGLGLSLSFDIIKAHGGDLKVENKPGEGVDFIINLPAK